MSILKSDDVMIFMGVRSFTGRSGNLLHMVTLADPVKYENFGFFVNLDKFDLDGVMNNSPVIPRFELGKFNNNIDLRLISVSPAPVKEIAK